MGKLLYQGHGSVRIQTESKKTIYIDPFINIGCDKEADIILITHSHFDHTNTDLIRKGDNCLIITYEDALKNGVYKSFEKDGIKISAVSAYNKNHPIDSCVGYVLEFDGIKIYAAGDTSKTTDMKEKLPEINITYALLPCDGVYNMDIKEASECARLINAKYTVPIHTSPVSSQKDAQNPPYDLKKAQMLESDSKLIIKPGEEREL